ncbi:hypothetical protein PZA11_002371 [Diplocarpon coronariae]
MPSFLSTLFAAALAVNSFAAAGDCKAPAFDFPILPGAEFVTLRTTEVTDYPHSDGSASLSFCNVTLTYTHPLQRDFITVQVWLPTKNWNGRFLGTGGSAYATGVFDKALAPAIELGYSAASTDGGHKFEELSAESWAHASPGNINLYLLQDFASVSLNEMTIIGKVISEKYYSMKPKYSYWDGCSTGGRQGLMMAQRYPTGYDGILAGAPAINWPSFVVAEYWPQFIMNQLNAYPSECELESLTAAAIAACDGNDGHVDGIISAPNLCHYDPLTAVNRLTICSDGSRRLISHAAAIVAKEAWTGPTKATGERLWFGLSYDAPLTGLANTISRNNVTRGSPFPVSADWIRLFVKKDSSFSLTSITQRDYENIFHASNQEFTSIIGTDDPDLSQFRDAGGKIITWHGLADELIFPNGTTNYYDRVAALDPKVRDYMRFFQAPGVGHCGGGVGPMPIRALDALVNWVENGKAPETLDARGPSINGLSRSERLCNYPLVSAYQGGDPLEPESYRCQVSF